MHLEDGVLISCGVYYYDSVEDAKSFCDKENEFTYAKQAQHWVLVGQENMVAKCYRALTS